MPVCRGKVCVVPGPLLNHQNKQQENTDRVSFLLLQLSQFGSQIKDWTPEEVKMEEKNLSALNYNMGILVAGQEVNVFFTDATV